jgi:protein-S-isoprenylcysteine O-methyltransferase Ste14
MREEERDIAGVVAPPPLIFGLGLALGLLLHRRRPQRFPPGLPHRTIGLTLIGAGLSLAVAAWDAMRRAGTSPDPTRPVRALVQSGPFRYSRNPMYLSLTLLYSGIALLLNAVTPLLILPAVLQVIRRGVIEREERYLDRRFGDEYRRYAARVRRWL